MATKEVAQVAEDAVEAIDNDSELKGIVRFAAKVRTGRTQGVDREFSVSLPFPIQPTDSVEDIVSKSRSVSFTVKGLVFDELGLQYAVDPNGILMEVITDAVEQQFPGTQTVQGGPGELTRPPHVNAELWTQLQNNPGDFYDNRNDAKSQSQGGNGPDFKRKSDGKGIWLKPKGN